MASFIPAVQLVDGYPRVSSLSISEHFEKRHTDVLRSINKVALECPPEFNERNFALVDFVDAKGEKRPMYQLSRDGFTLVVMGFTGKRALEWKVKYIEAFNAMERALLEGKHGEPVSLTPSSADDRAPLRALVHAWSQVCGQTHSALWPQVKGHFQLSRIDDLPIEWLPDALAFVQSKIDSLPKALPAASVHMPYNFEQAMQVNSSVAARANNYGMNLYNEFKAMSEEASRSFRLSNEACVAGHFDFLLSECEQNMKRLAGAVFEITLAYSSQAAALKKLAQLMLRAEKQ